MQPEPLLVSCNGVEIATNAFGRPGDPPVLLIMGATASMLWWPDAFCVALASRGMHVLRFDNRDTGMSTHFPAGAPDYSIHDMVDDAVAVLDGWHLASAHLVGMSLGGWISQILALTKPDRVRSLTLIAAEPLGPGDPEAAIGADFLAHFGALSKLDWADRTAVTDWMVETARLSGRRPFDATAARERASAEWDRARGNLASAFNHAALSGGEELAGQLSGLRPPLTLVHGTADPILPFARALAFSRIVPAARLVPLEGAGHELHPTDWPEIIDEIARQVSGADRVSEPSR